MIFYCNEIKQNCIAETCLYSEVPNREQGGHVVFLVLNLQKLNQN